MPTPLTISDAEWQVMRALWAAPGPRTANDVVDAVAAANRWSPRTVKTLLNRLVKKGALRFEAKGKVYWYAPAVAQDDCVRTEARSFLARVFGGDSAAMLVHFVKHTRLSRAEIAELKRILDRKEK